MRKNNLKIQMLVEKRLKICVGATSEISVTLVWNACIKDLTVIRKGVNLVPIISSLDPLPT